MSAHYTRSKRILELANERNRINGVPVAINRNNGVRNRKLHPHKLPVHQSLRLKVKRWLNFDKATSVSDHYDGVVYYEYVMRAQITGMQNFFYIYIFYTYFHTSCRFAFFEILSQLKETDVYRNYVSYL